MGEEVVFGLQYITLFLATPYSLTSAMGKPKTAWPIDSMLLNAERRGVTAPAIFL